MVLACVFLALYGVATTLYSVALALSGGNSNSGTTQLFINLNTENSFLDDQGFTVFGQVVAGIAQPQPGVEAVRPGDGRDPGRHGPAVEQRPGFAGRRRPCDIRQLNSPSGHGFARGPAPSSPSR